MSEFTPPGSNLKMTKSQVRKYIAQMQANKIIAQEKLKQAKDNGEFEKEELELAELEKKLDEWSV